MDSRSLLSNDSGKITYLGRTCHLSLRSRELFVFDAAEKRVIKIISFASVVGSKAVLSSNEQDLSVLKVYDYKFDETKYLFCFQRKKYRKCETVNFQFADGATCQQWSNAINNMILSEFQLPTDVQSYSSEEDGTSPSQNHLSLAPRPKRFIVFVNPISGQGLATSIWKNQIEPMMTQSGSEVKLVITQYANHARDIMEDFDPSAYDCIMTVGGDGLLSEIINGLSARSKGDGEHMLRTVSVAPIPGGTGNGLIKSILHECGEELSVINAVFMALKGHPEFMDLSNVETCSRSYRSFLLLGWGLISDIDLLSERWRCLGELRLHLAAVYFILLKRFYRGRLSIYTGDTNHSQSRHQSLVSLPPFNETIIEGDGWEVIDDYFLFIWVVQTSHVSASMYSGPGVASNDGMFTIYVVTEMSRLEVLQLLLVMDTGDHVNHPKVKTFKCTAYRIEPHSEASSQGLYTLDGEMIEYGPIQAIMRPASARIMKMNSQSSQS